MHRSLATTAAAIMFMAASAPAQVMTTTTTATTTHVVSGCNPDKVKVESFTASSSAAVHGQSVTARLKIKNNCYGAKVDVPWRIFVGTTTVASGTALQLPAGGSIEVSGAWPAVIGAHELDAEIDKNNTLNETSADRGNNVPVPVSITVTGDWASWKEKAKAAVRTSMRNWIQQAALKNVVIYGPIASKGSLQGPSMAQLMKGELSNQGVPAVVAEAIAGGIDEGWTAWAGSVTVPNLPWWPAFGSVGQAVSPKLAALTSEIKQLQRADSKMDGRDQAIRSRLGNLAAQTGAEAAITEIAATVAQCFAHIPNAKIANVIGWGNVPSYSLATPLGPVYDGRGNGAPGHITLPSFC